ncbi:hypothetical protein PGTUg99_031096 [Puccinia graminis f. sp. tritici]|nr:hypothetical protein PGTUg99_029592 [Puccinia graminis f. sp. tritici]KAA1138612.1 hypothetical protein PGTUg99_031096 [Puccinia graminis f. sp. tritici]
MRGLFHVHDRHYKLTGQTMYSQQCASSTRFTFQFYVTKVRSAMLFGRRFCLNKPGAARSATAVHGERRAATNLKIPMTIFYGLMEASRPTLADMESKHLVARRRGCIPWTSPDTSVKRARANLFCTAQPALIANVCSTITTLGPKTQPQSNTQPGI